LIKEISRHKNRVKSFLYCHGIPIPDSLAQSSRYWSGKFTQWLTTVKMSTPWGDTVLQNTLETIEGLRGRLLEINRQLRSIYKDSPYSRILKLLQSIPGVGLIMAVTILSELENLVRFKNLDKLCSYVGIVPMTFSSGDKEKVGSITPRANKPLRNCIIEAAWIASRNDPSLALCFNELSKRMKPNKAIVRIAKKLLNRIRYVMINEKEYVHSIVQ